MRLAIAAAFTLLATVPAGAVDLSTFNASQLDRSIAAAQASAVECEEELRTAAWGQKCLSWTDHAAVVSTRERGRIDLCIAYFREQIALHGGETRAKAPELCARADADSGLGRVNAALKKYDPEYWVQWQAASANAAAAISASQR